MLIKYWLLVVIFTNVLENIYYMYHSHTDKYVKTDMKSYMPLETAAIFFLANLFSKTGY